MIRGMFVAFLILIFAAMASAQELSGSINGRVEDTSQTLVPGVVVTLTSPALQSERSATSDDKGFYRIAFVPPGTYSVKFELPGFKTIVREGVEIGVGNTVTLNTQMQLAIVAEKVDVTGETTALDVQNATIGVNFNNEILRDIPNQRDLWAILAETPGITMTNFDVGGNTMGTQSGYRSYGVSGQVLLSVDGVNATEHDAGAGIYMDYGALEQVKVAGAANPAEVPVAGAAVTAVIKSGSNDRHGEVFSDWTGPAFQAMNPSPGFHAYDTNAQFGGPFVRDKFWYFVSFRNDYFGQTTGILSAPVSQGGTLAVDSRLLQNYTIKLNYQLSSSNTLAFTTQVGRKYFPYRGGVLVSFLSQYTYESTSLEDAWNEIGKVELTHVIDNRKTLDMSINNFGYQLPFKSHTATTPLMDDISGLPTGAYSRPELDQQRRWHYNANLSAYAGKNDMKAGYMFQWYAPRSTSYGAPGAGTVGHLFIDTNSGVPTSFTTDNGPVWNENVVRQNSFFVQDKFQVIPRLTLNFGLRYDRYDSSYPLQRFGLDGNKPCQASGPCALGPFVTPTVTPANHVATFNTFVPRLAFVYDLFGNTGTTIRGSWGRYSTNPTELPGLVNPVNLITTRYAWDPNVLGADPIAGARLITPAYVAALPIQSGGGQLTPAAVDPNLKDSYTDEYTAGVEHQLLSTLGVHVNWVRKLQKNTYGIYDRLHTFAAFAPVAAIDPGPDGLIGTSDDKRITVFDRLNAATPIDNYLTNQPIGDNYTTIEFGASKRMRNHWMLMPSFDWTKRNLAQALTQDPDVLLWGATSNAHTEGWTAKIIGEYLLPHGLMLSAFMQNQKGEAYARSAIIQTANLTAADPSRTTPLNEGNLTIYAQPGGSYYLPAIHLIGARIQKDIEVRDQQKIQFMLSLFNLANSTTVTGVNTSTGRSGNAQTFGQTTAKMLPLAARFGVRYVF